MSFMEEFSRKTEGLLEQKERLLIAIDGRCAAGKTTLAEEISRQWDAATVHMDNFFLRPEQRTAERLAEPGGNVDRERFFEEVLLPLKNGKNPSYRPYDCHAGQLGEPILLPEKKIYIIEGSYSCHPYFYDCYDLKIFADVDGDEQIKRIRQRNGAAFQNFIEKWIPYEERYFDAFQTEKNCDLVYKT